jgi:predicted small lipoprotein YifL
LSPFAHRRLVRLAVVGALAAALGLAGCGRKGGLEAPPDASLAEPGPAPQAAPLVGPDGKALAPTQGPKRTTPLDFLID